MARNYIDLMNEDEDDFELFEKLNHTSRHKNKNADSQEKIKQQRRQRQRMKDNAINREEYWDE